MAEEIWEEIELINRNDEGRNDEGSARRRAALTPVTRQWLRRPDQEETATRTGRRRSKCFWATLLATTVVIVVWVEIAKHHHRPLPPPPPGNYTVALKKSLLFFNAQKSGHLPENNNVSWRGDSCLSDGIPLKNLSGGYYDSGDATKANFPAAFSITLLSWSVIEYRHSYEEAGELEHIKETIKWGTDFLLKTFDSSSEISSIFTQVGGEQDSSCWMRPEDVDYARATSRCHTCSDLASEMAAAFASASIIFQDTAYSKGLIRAAQALYKFAWERRGRYSDKAQHPILYESSNYWDEIMWASTWLYYATEDLKYLEAATTRSIATKAGGSGIFSWDNKFPGATLLLTRLRMFLMSPGNPYEEMLAVYHEQTQIMMCSYLKNFTVHNWTRGGLIVLNEGKPKPLQFVVNTVYLATLFSDYHAAQNIHGWSCGPDLFLNADLQRFGRDQMDYLLGRNPRNMSYVVGFGDRYPTQVHHRGASIPDDHHKYNCKEGWKWRDSSEPNPNVVIGAMVAGPDNHDGFRDNRSNPNYTEPSLAGNAGLTSALAALLATTTGLDRNGIFSRLQPPSVDSPPPPAPWEPCINC